MDDPKKLLAELLRANLVKDPALAAKRRRLLEKLAAAEREPDPLEMQHQQRMMDGVAAKLWPERGGSDNP